MSNSRLKLATLLLAALFISDVGYAQENSENESLKIFGIGINFDQITSESINIDIGGVRPNIILFTFNSNEQFRLEPELGYGKFNDKDGESSVRNFHAGIGLYGLHRAKKLLFHGGMKFGYSSILSENENSFGNPSQRKYDRFSVGPQLGVEFLLVDRFSVGGNIGLSYVSLKELEDSPFNSSVDHEYFSTSTGINLRCYF